MDTTENITKLSITGAYCTIPALYDRIALELGLSTNAHYDCKRVCVSPKIQQEVFDYCKAQGQEDMGTAMQWLCFGPKAVDTLKDYEVTVEEGWYTGSEETDV